MEKAFDIDAIILKTLGPFNSRIFIKIYNDYYWLLYKWNEFNELYAKTERLALLNESTSLFFYMVQNSMMADIYTGISRLTDPIRKKKSDNENITFLRLPEMIDDSEIRKKIDDKIVELKIYTANIRNARNKYLSHSDLKENMKSSAFLFNGEEIKQTMNLLYEVLNIIYCDLFKTNLAKEIIAPLSGATTLMSILRDGIEYRKKIYQLVENGDYKALEEMNKKIPI